MAVHTLALSGSEIRTEPRVSRGPFGAPWVAIVVVAELLFLLCRAGVQDWVSIDDPICWLAGLAPFLAAAIAQQFGIASSYLYIEVWISALISIVVLQLSGLAHFIDYPIFLTLDEGYARYLAYSLVYAACAAVFVFAIRWIFASSKVKLGLLLIALPEVAVTLAFTLFPKL